MRSVPQTATGVPKPAAPSKNAPKAEGDEEQLEAAVACDSDEALLQQREPACACDELVQEEHREDDPADGEETVSRAVAGRQKGEAGGHVKDEESDCECGGKACECGDVSFDAKAGHGDEEDNERQGGECGGEKPGVRGVVALRPSGGENR